MTGPGVQASTAFGTNPHYRNTHINSLIGPKTGLGSDQFERIQAGLKWCPGKQGDPSSIISLDDSLNKPAT
jgi:hypothetical protein